jgi:NADH-quinone oxidoreductase subunit C
MNKTELGIIVKSFGQECEIKEGSQFTEVTVPASSLHALAVNLREKEECSFDFLVSITGVDYGQDLGAVYHLRSIKHGHMIVLKVRTGDREDPHFDSVTDIWKSADFLEREVYDLFGIKFTNHPDLRRLFLDRSWGFPFRKDFADDIKIVTK